ncbi:glucan endo-1,3-beta-glucosidase 13 [Arachis duranensis]|uniref:Glucan endo-1,3-beta-glucosidase 13 n=1 Tax=Arachis duranensis TaxID=130453 RepID=A0A6P4D839_ARADU|nr:glucan endo-1,3-beta-glucosidase 13 [Arachis duranensis]XP_057762574.1 glucan endo-1,3-beta-glucosidase 13-like [Arachis stenosperma]
MLKMAAWLIPLFILCSLGLTGAGQESVEFITLCQTTEDILEASSSTNAGGSPPLAVHVSHGDLNGVSSSILLAETWLRSNVLAYYPASNITTILVTNHEHQHNQNLGLVLHSLKNLHHSLKRWGLEKHIKVSFALFPLNSFYNNDDFKMVKLKPIVEFLQSVNSTYSLIHSHYKDLTLVSSHLDSIKKLRFLSFNTINFVTTTIPNGRRRLSASKIGSIPPLPEIAEPPLDFPVPYSAPPKNVEQGKPLPPLAQIVSSPPPLQQPPAPFLVPAPASPPEGFDLPPCNPIDNNGSPSPMIIPVQKLWCVAKPHVPEDTLQQGLDYACGEGGADCTDILPQGNCYSPDTLVAHASFAFNSYWQKHKRHGGTCSFGGTAMLINSDPSYLQCRFILS